MGQRGGEEKGIHGDGMEAKEEISRKDTHRVMRRNSTEENRRKYKSMKNKAKKAVSKAMTEVTELQNCPKWHA